MRKEIWLIYAISTFDSWKTSNKDVILAESTEEEAKATCKQFEDKKKEEKSLLEGYECYYIYQKIYLYN